MTKPIYLLLFSLLPFTGLYAQEGSKDRNYRIESIVRKAGVTNICRLDSLPAAETIRKIYYYDGFGYPLQEISVGAAQGGKDLVRHRHYDSYRRESRTYLPYADAGDSLGLFRSDAALRTQAYYGDSLRSGMPPTACPYSETVFEHSLLDRVLEQGAPGEIWQPAAQRDERGGRTVLTEYGTCRPFWEESVKLFSATKDGLSYDTDYLNGYLTKTVQKDENWTSGRDGVLETYTDRHGKTVLERHIQESDGKTDFLDTYYVYDEIGRLRYVLPPMAADRFRQTGETCADNDSLLTAYGYTYRYDNAGNCIYKRLPGADAQEMIYDKAHRMVLSRDGKCRKAGKWMFHLYDALGRQVVQGICSSPDVQALKNEVVTTQRTDSGILEGYEAPAALGTDLALLKVNYYDDYSFTEGLEAVECDGYDAPYPSTEHPDGRGLLTGTATYAADGSGARLSLKALYYDSRTQVVQERELNHRGELVERFFKYSFTGMQEAVKTRYGNTEEVTVYDYDQMDRLVEVRHRINGGEEETLCHNRYDDLGRLIAQERNGEETLKTEYAYNLRGWTTEIRNPLFGERLHYTDGTGTPCYNGNISSMNWQAGNENSVRGYNFGYDSMNRLSYANYGEGKNLLDNPNSFNEEVTGYDKMGNIFGIRRMGQTAADNYNLIDNLALAYTGNKLCKVTDHATDAAYANGFEFKDGANEEVEYTYDENGNLTQDLNKNIADIQYNYLNLPQVLKFGDGTVLTYLYDADGNKLRTQYQADGKTTTTDYTGNLVYENGTPVRLNTGYGYVSLQGSMYHYYLQDHQGNNRVVADRNGTVEEVNHYYPFGGLFATNGNIQPYKYNGKELEARKGLNWYDYGARHYDAALGRWQVMDPMAEKYGDWSPYSYCKDSPVMRVDLDGKDDYVMTKVGSIALIKKTNSQYDRLSYYKNPDTHVTISDKKVLPSMVKNQRSSTYGFSPYGATSNAADAAKIFKLGADSTPVEWRLDAYDNGETRQFVVGTDQQIDRVGNGKKEADRLKVKGNRVIDIHSHPSDETQGASKEDQASIKAKKNAVYFKRDATLHEYDASDANLNERKINTYLDLEQYISSK